MTKGQLPQRAGLPGLNGGGAAAAVPPRVIVAAEESNKYMYIIMRV